MPRKILIINSFCGCGSTGRIVENSAREWKAKGAECRVAYGRDKVGCEDIATYQIGNRLDYQLHGLKTRIFDQHGFGSKAVTERFIKWVEDYDPDLIHLHNIHGYYINIQILFDYLKRSGKKILWTLHDCWAFTGHCTYFDFAGCAKWKSGCHTCPQKKEYPRSLVCDNSKSNYKRKKEIFTGVRNLTIITPSHWLAELVQASYLKEYPVQVLHNTIDPQVFKPRESDFRDKNGLLDKKIVLGVASIWEKRKGLDDFYALAKLLSDDYQIVLVGLNDKQMKEKPFNILGIGRTDSAVQLAELYTAADVFVNPTYEDNYPTVNLESKACGTPVITYNTGGSVESVEAENVVEKGNVSRLLKRIEQICMHY